MKKYTTLLFVLFISINFYAQDNIIWDLSFKNTSIGPLSEAELEAEGDGMDWMSLNNNSYVVDDAERNNSLRIKYPAGHVGPNGDTGGPSGSQFIKYLPSAKEYYLDYYVKFEDGFEFVLGGKLPGLTSGGSAWTGGYHPSNGEGFSARYMWVQNGKMLLYFYYWDMKDKGSFEWEFPLGVNFEKGRWYRLTQRIKLNTTNVAGQGDGILQIWVDGVQVIYRNDIRYMNVNGKDIDTFYFSTFYGGASSDWAPSKDTYTRFDKFVVSTDIPDLSTDTGTSTNYWKSYDVGIYPNIFNVEFDLKANKNIMDGVTGILQGTATNYPDLSCIVRFNEEGKIDSYDGNTYKADVDVLYISSDLFHVSMNINMNTEKYDVYISKNGGGKLLLASDYSFRKNNLSMLNSWAIKAEIGSHTVTNVKFSNGALSNDTHEFYDMSIYPNVFSSEFNFTFKANQLLNNHELKFSLITLNGDVLETQELRVKNTKTSLSFNSLSNQSSGMYLLLIEGDSFVHTVKLLKK